VDTVIRVCVTGTCFLHNHERFHAAAFQRPVSRLEGAFIMVDCRVVALHCRYRHHGAFPWFCFHAVNIHMCVADFYLTCSMFSTWLFFSTSSDRVLLTSLLTPLVEVVDSIFFAPFEFVVTIHNCVFPNLLPLPLLTFSCCFLLLSINRIE
jgi:hypothetical protein